MTTAVATDVQRPAVVMGTTAHVLVAGADAPSGRELLEQIRRLEALWSRFRHDSEISQLRRADGRPVVVSHDTAALLQRGVWAWAATGGLYDPTVLGAVEAAGYDRTFAEIGRDGGDSAPSHPAPGCDGIEVDPHSGLVRLPAGVGIDPGGIGKGLAADLVAVRAVDAGAASALVSVGGDLRVAGSPPDDGWEIELDHHLGHPARVNLRAGAVATSTVLQRRWMTSAGEMHHVIDPRTGRPLRGAAVACSVVAGEAWWAEALATAVLVGWEDPGFADGLDVLLGGAGALVTLADGRRLTAGGAAGAFCPAPPAPAPRRAVDPTAPVSPRGNEAAVR